MYKIYEDKQALSPKLLGLAIGIISAIIFLIIFGIAFPFIYNGMKNDNLDDSNMLIVSVVILLMPIILGFVLAIIGATISSGNKKNIKLYGENGYIYYDDGISVFRFHKEDIISTKCIDYLRLVGRSSLIITIKHLEYKSFKTGEFIEATRKIKLLVSTGLKPKNKKDIIERIYAAERRSKVVEGD
ncbi:MAG: hypothetical protein K6A63_04460 [Acholeplasmatales bacterium]|nr:hypothetical protein [Acholeplasmatales bacterium]